MRSRTKFKGIGVQWRSTSSAIPEGQEVIVKVDFYGADCYCKGEEHRTLVRTEEISFYW